MARLVRPVPGSLLPAFADGIRRVTTNSESLLDSEWRSRITAAWLIGLSRREPFRRRLGGLLLVGDLTYAGAWPSLSVPFVHDEKERLTAVSNAEASRRRLERCDRSLPHHAGTARSRRCRWSGPWPTGFGGGPSRHRPAGTKSPRRPCPRRNCRP
ncbi:DUF6000 family protein [Streptomyces sp. NPDC097727]|uniref:DUF6000 family protein n=1 Tax=Streptomyces sp. NPDC097727 TaxID=3366092 RepID=UPI00382D9DE0